MHKKAYISIENGFVKILAPSGKNPKPEDYYIISKDKTLNFLREKKIKKVLICGFYPELLSLKIHIPFAGKQLKNKKIIDGFIKSEVNRRYPTLKDFSYYYTIIYKDLRSWIRAYLISKQELTLFNVFITNEVEVVGNYPILLLVEELLSSVQKIDSGCQLICLPLGKVRYLFVFLGREMIFQRVYEAEQESLGSEDVMNINMTISYSIQNLRVNPAKVVFISKKQELSEIRIPIEFISLWDNTSSDYLLLDLLRKLENRLKGKEILHSSYKRFIKIRNYLRHACYFISLLCVILLLYTGSMFKTILERSEEIAIHKKEISNRQQIFLNLKREIEEFEKTSKPLIELYSQKASFPDMRIPINSIAKASNLTQLEINSIEIENKTPQRIKITGKVIASSFSEKQLIYSNFKESMQNEGFRLSQDRWDFTKGEFTLEAEYEPKRVF